MDNPAVEVLKWIGIVFAAGFVGYFGRHLAMMLIDRMRRKKSEPPSTPETVQQENPSPEATLAAAQAKIEKKKAKAEAKKAKKQQ